MPFTGSHPAAVLPLLLNRRARAWLAPFGLVIGSMAPDLPYYLPVPVPVTWTHSAHGVVGLDLAMGLLGVWVWHGLIGPAAVAVAPLGLRRRLPVGVPMPARSRLRGRRLVAAVVSLLIGATTHVVWDAFTHPDRFGTHHLRWLASPQFGGLDGYRWAQYASGLLGGAALLLSVVLWWRATEPAAPSLSPPSAGARLSGAVWTAVLGATAAGGLAGALHARDDGVRRMLFSTATWGGGLALAAALLAAVVVVRSSPVRSAAVRSAAVRSRAGDAPDALL